MVQEGNITAQDAMRHAEALNSVRVRKKGDAQRILLMNMVKVRCPARPALLMSPLACLNLTLLAPLDLPRPTPHNHRRAT